MSRFLARYSMSNDGVAEARRAREAEWQAMHRQPDAPPSERAVMPPTATVRFSLSRSCGASLGCGRVRSAWRRDHDTACSRSPASIRTGSRFSEGVSGHENFGSYTHDGW